MSSEPIMPPTVGLTEEAAAALGMDSPNGHLGTDSATSDSFDEGITEAPFPFLSSGDTINDEVVDAELIDEPEEPKSRPRAARRTTREKSSPPGPGSREAKAGPPSLDEWTRFFSRVVLRVVTEWYLNIAFRGIDEETLSERELDRLALTDDERQTIAVPFAELSHKSKFMRKHGRTIVASGDALNAAIVLGAWFSRVNRIAARHRPKQPKSQVRINGSSGQGTPEASAEAPTGATGGRFPEWFHGPIFPGSS